MLYDLCKIDNFIKINWFFNAFYGRNINTISYLMSLPLKVLITGTNKGIGNELVKLFLACNPNTQIFATSREP
jgi:hypothetical protein